MMNINLNLYKSFYLVAKYGGFTNASKKALINQSSLSTNVKNLEDTLGVKLFERKQNNVFLTKEGEALFEKLEEVIFILEEKKEKRCIRIGCIRAIADSYIGDVIKEFNKIMPDISFEIRFLESNNLFQSIKKDEFDFVVCRYPTFFKFEKNFKVEKIIDTDNVFVCSKEKYDELTNEEKFKLVLPDSSEKRRIVDRYLNENNIEYEVIIELPNSNLLRQLVKDGIGIGYINSNLIREELDNGLLKIVDIFKEPPTDDVTIIYNSRKIDIVLEEFLQVFKRVIKKNDN